MCIFISSFIYSAGISKKKLKKVLLFFAYRYFYTEYEVER
ncbi:hypothetical protein JBW_03142 [Pelosinus fermentans JBW45]|uniref:Uncharacterized protein n=1 Tax=Pelosinus fermentans JBW45 TaxID=1192197 RepID=I8TSH4_9FIRM|nr:hypothetical protein JBW_03142 [Pelosinus fermentans JBW45]